MTTCRFCGEMVLTKPQKLASIETPVIKKFLTQTNSIVLNGEDSHKLICKQCEVTAKGYAAFVDKIKGTQAKFRLPRLKKTAKRPVPVGPIILLQANNNNTCKRMKQGKDPIVGMIGECTLIRRVDIRSIENEPVTKIIDNSNKEEEEEFGDDILDLGESSREAFNGSYTCKTCAGTFYEGRAFVEHLEVCLPKPKCPICGILFEAHDLLTLHLKYHHDFISFYDDL